MSQINLTPTNSGGHNAIRVTVNFTETNVNNINNTSDVYYEVILSRNAWTTSWYGYGQKIYVTVTINGVANTVYIPRYNYGGKNLPGSTFGTGTVAGIVHSNDGSKTINISASITDKAKESYTSGSASASSTMALTNIPRASSFSFSGTTLNSATSVSINRASSSFTHTLVYTMGNVSQSYTGLTTSASFTRPYSDAQQFGAYNTSGTGSLTLITYNGGTEIGRTSKTIVMTIPDNNDTRPSASSSTTITDAVSGITQKFNAFVQANSRLLFTFNYNGKYGANIKEYSVTIDNKTYTNNSNTITTDPIYQSGSVNYSCKIKDTRGRIVTESGIVSILAYLKPNLSITVERTQEQSCNVYLTGSISPVNNLNDKLLSIKYKVHSASTYQSINVPLGANEYTINKTVAVPISDSSSYDFYGRIEDYFNFYDTSVEHLSTAFDLMHFRPNGLGIGIGKKAEFDALDIGMDIYYKGETLDNYIKGVFDDYDEEEF